MYISEVMETLDMSKKSIEVYEKHGLIKPQKDASGYRIYGEKEILLLRKIQMLRRMDFSIAEIQILLDHYDYEIFSHKRDTLQREAHRIATKIQYLDYVEATIGSGQEFIEINEDIQKSFDVFDDDKIKEEMRRIEQINFNKIINVILGIGIILIFCSSLLVPIEYINISMTLAVFTFVIAYLLDKVVGLQIWIAKILFKLGFLKDQ